MAAHSDAAMIVEAGAVTGTGTVADRACAGGYRNTGIVGRIRSDDRKAATEGHEHDGHDEHRPRDDPDRPREGGRGLAPDQTALLPNRITFTAPRIYAVPTSKTGVHTAERPAGHEGKLPMSIDFANAHERHQDDASYLDDTGRLANADHLYGFSAECGLKALMTLFGMPVKVSGDPEDQMNRKHIEIIWGRYSAYTSAPYSTDYQLESENAFTDWRVSDRYAADTNVTTSRLSRHREGAKHVHDLINRARVEGLLT
ncbi:hypothetical protein [Brachybacterium sp. 107]|uniref:hypothetical protein n=1 Tax=Brachybacterium sp. 107 TaxID=3457736 RepID=UPI0040332F32